MHTCKNCYYCQYAYYGNKTYKCKMHPETKRFNFPFLHGFFCKYFLNKNKI